MTAAALSRHLRSISRGAIAQLSMTCIYTWRDYDATSGATRVNDGATRAV